MIDRGLPTEWPESVREACDRFKQGHLVETPPFFYAGSTAHGVWDLTRETGDRDIPEEVFELDKALAAPFGLVTTNTCDIYEERNPKRPWVQVAPVYDASDVIPKGSVGNLKTDGFVYLMLLDASTLGDGLWVVDFRIEVPVEKSWLVGKEPIEAFASEERYLVLADKLAARVGRPAFSDALVALLRVIFEWWERADVEARKSVVSVRLAIVEGDRLNPRSAFLVIVTDSDEMSVAGRAAWEECWRRASEVGDDFGINLTANQHATLDSLSARQFRDSAPLLP